MPRMCSIIIFGFNMNTTAFLRLIQPSSTTIKELHGLVDQEVCPLAIDSQRANQKLFLNDRKGNLLLKIGSMLS